MVLGLNLRFDDVVGFPVGNVMVSAEFCNLSVGDVTPLGAESRRDG